MTEKENKHKDIKGYYKYELLKQTIIQKQYNNVELTSR